MLRTALPQRLAEVMLVTALPGETPNPPRTTVDVVVLVTVSAARTANSSALPSEGMNGAGAVDAVADDVNAPPTRSRAVTMAMAPSPMVGFRAWG